MTALQQEHWSRSQESAITDPWGSAFLVTAWVTMSSLFDFLFSVSQENLVGYSLLPILVLNVDNPISYKAI